MKSTDDTLNIADINPALGPAPAAPAAMPAVAAATPQEAPESALQTPVNVTTSIPEETPEPIPESPVKKSPKPHRAQRELKHHLAAGTKPEPHSETPPVPKPESLNPEVQAARAEIEKASDVFSQPTETLHPLLLNAPAAPPKAKQDSAEDRTMAPYQLSFPSKLLRPILGALGTFLFVLTIFEAPVIFHQINFLVNQNQTKANDVASAAVGPDSVIDIPKINVHAPVVFESSTNEGSIQTALQNGVVHYGNTPVPGTIGNDVIVGHSSNDWWEPGNYKFVFVLLDKLIPGDSFSINYNYHHYIYHVTESKVVEPTDLGVLAPTSDATVTLITCTPPGTSWKRLVVVAKQVGPASDSVQTVQQTTTGTPLPSDSSGLGNMFKHLWQNVQRLFGGSAQTNQTPNQAPQNTLPQD